MGIRVPVSIVLASVAQHDGREALRLIEADN